MQCNCYWWKPAGRRQESRHLCCYVVWSLLTCRSVFFFSDEGPGVIEILSLSQQYPPLDATGPLFLSSGANRFHLGPPFLLLGFRYQSIDNLYKRKRIASVAKGPQTDRRLFVCDHHGAHTLVLFIYLSFQFFVCPPLFKNGRRRRRASWSGVEETCSPGATLSPSRKAAGGLPSSLTLPFGEREPFSSSSWRWEKGGRLLLLLHYKPSGTEGERERERKETRRIIISMTRDNVQKITIGKKKRRRCWTVVVAAETSVAATAAADEFQRLRANFMAIVSFSFSSTAGWLLLPFQILTAAIYQVMHLWCLGAAATAACPFIFIMHLCGIRIYIYIFFSFFFLINPIVKWPFFPLVSLPYEF